MEAELRDARVKHRRHPRKHGYGLPGLPVRLSFELAPQDHAVVARGLEKVASEMSDSLGGARPAPVEALVYLLRRVLETEESVTQGRAVLFVTARVAAVPTPSAGRRPGLQDTATTSDSAPMVGARISGTRPGAASGVTPPFTPAA